MRAAALTAASLLLAASSAAAQTYRPPSAVPRAGAVEIGGSVIWSGGYDAGGLSAGETPNASGNPFTLFTTSSKLTAAPGAEARVGVYLSKRLIVEGLFQYSRPVLRLSAADDFENAAATTIEQRVTSYLAGGSLVYDIGQGHVVPFVLGGGGYLRQLDEDKSDAITGSEFHGGGGVKVWFGSRVRRFGVRFDAQVSSRSKSAGFEDKRRMLPTLGAGVAYRF